MANLNSYVDKDGETVTLWLPGDTEKDRRLVYRIREAIAAELTERFADGDWNVGALLEAGADVNRFYEAKEAEANAAV